MKIWLPFVATGTGTDVYTETLADSLRSRGHEAVTTPFAHSWQYLPGRLRLAPAPEHADVILANSWNAFAFKRKGIPLVSVVHHLVLGAEADAYRSRAQALFHETLVRRFETSSAKRADAVVAVSEFTAGRIEAHLGVAGARVIYNGVDTDFFRPLTTEPTNDRPTQLLFVGTLSNRKGADLLPQIMKELGPGFELRYTGDPTDNALVRPGPTTTAMGRLDRAELRTAYQQADLLLFPTRLEGLGLVALEAMACGTPVVASRTGPLVEIVEDGMNGVLCPVDDVAAFADAVRNLSNDQQRLAAMGQSARATVQAKFTIEQMAAGYLDLVESIVAGG